MQFQNGAYFKYQPFLHYNLLLNQANNNEIGVYVNT